MTSRSVVEQVEQSAQSIRQPSQPNDFELGAFLYNLIESQITRADTKAGLVIAADTVFLTALILLSHGMLPRVLDASESLLARAFAVVMCLVFVMLVCSALVALVAARPTLKVRKDGATPIFFLQISQMEQREYVDALSKETPTELRRALLAEVHNASRIAHRKFVCVRYSVDFLIASVLLWVVLQVLRGLIP